MKMPFDVKKYLENMPQKPLTSVEKEMLWSKIEEKINAAPQEKPRRFPFFHFLNRDFFANMNRRFAYAAISLCAILGISAAGVAAAQSSRPGDFLFPVELAVEKIQITFANRENKDELKIKFAGKRFDEAKYVLAVIDSTATSTNSVSSATTSAAVYAYKNVKNLEKAEYALTFALEQLEKTRDNFEKEGNTAAMATIDKIIEELKALTENHLNDLENLQAEITNSDAKIKEMKNYNDKLKIKFKFSRKNNNGDEEEISNRPADSANSTTSSIKMERQGNGLKIGWDKNRKNNRDNENKEKIVICHIPPGNRNNPQTIEISASALRAHLAHGDILGVCNGRQTATTTPPAIPDTTAPAISDVSATSTTSVSTTISWKTDESAMSKIWYDTITPLIISTSTPLIENSDMVLTHSLVLSSLTASTTYYYKVSSEDASGNTATSSEFSFVTLPNE